ncbi:MAG: CRTAC1 family protein, partial [Holophagales bacterium]|nr:CRTAC1 family protein [Holophagales bacterium]
MPDRKKNRRRGWIHGAFVVVLALLACEELAGQGPADGPSSEPEQIFLSTLANGHLPDDQQLRAWADSLPDTWDRDGNRDWNAWHQAGGDRLFRNMLISGTVGGGSFAGMSTPRFTDVSEQAGIYGSEIGFGLGVSVGDVNRDGWPDMYVSNDFFERDYLYLNNQDGTFEETLEESIKSVSAAAMGADMADLNGDGYPEFFVTDMLPKQEYRLKTVTSFDSWERYQNYIKDDYYHQFTRNTLHLNRGHVAGGRLTSAAAAPVYFSEIGRMAGVEASDWSWGAMIADFDLDGYRDLFVANGIYQDLTNADYLVEIRDEETMNRLISENYVDFKTLIDMIPSNPISNYLFAGRPDLRFQDVTTAWGLSEPGFSNGSAYGDLDNDGDLDLVVNNVNMEAFVYRNRATDLYPNRAWLQVGLQGPSPNTLAVGAQVTAWSGQRQWYVEQQPVRGFQSTIDPTLHFGFGVPPPSGRLDSLVVRWP